MNKNKYNTTIFGLLTHRWNARDWCWSLEFGRWCDESRLRRRRRRWRWHAAFITYYSVAAGTCAAEHTYRRRRRRRRECCSTTSARAAASTTLAQEDAMRVLTNVYNVTNPRRTHFVFNFSV